MIKDQDFNQNLFNTYKHKWDLLVHEVPQAQMDPPVHKGFKEQEENLENQGLQVHWDLLVLGDFQDYQGKMLVINTIIKLLSYICPLSIFYI